MNEIRWHQRLKNFEMAFRQLSKFIAKDNLNELEEQGLIQCFEYNFELAWNSIKDFYKEQGETDIQGSRDAFRMAFNRGLIKNGEKWMEMIKSRTLTSHTYNEDTALQVITSIKNEYFGLFKELVESLNDHL